MRLASADGVGVVRLDYDGRDKTWLLTAFDIEGKSPRGPDDGRGPAGDRDGSPGLGDDFDIEDLRQKVDGDMFAVAAEVDADGKVRAALRRADELLADLDADQAAIDAVRDCLL